MANFAPSPSPETRGTAADGPVMRPRETVGDLLRRARQEQGAEIAEVASLLRIRAPYLAAIEQARYDRLPGPVYALGFVRTYANHLNLDGEEAVRRFKLEAAGLEQRRDLAFPMPLTPRSIPGGRMILAAFVLAVCAYGIWHYLSTGDRARPERVAAVPAALLPPPPPPAPSAAPSDASAPAAPAAADQTALAPPPSAPVTAAPAPVTAAPLPTAAAPSASLVAPPPPVLPSQGATPPSPAPAAPPPTTTTTITVAPAPQPSTSITVAADPADAAAAAPSQPHVFGAVNGPSRITLRAVKDCWIQIRDGNDPAQTVVTQRTLRAGDTYRVPDRAGLVLRTGNAAGLEVAVDDRTAPTLGGTVKNVALDPTRLAAGTARVE